MRWFQCKFSRLWWESPGFNGLNRNESSGGVSAMCCAGAKASDPGCSPSAGNSIADYGFSGESSTGGSGGVGGSESSSAPSLQFAMNRSDFYREGDLNQSPDMLNKSLSLDPYPVRAWMARGCVFGHGRLYRRGGRLPGILSKRSLAKQLASRIFRAIFRLPVLYKRRNQRSARPCQVLV